MGRAKKSLPEVQLSVDARWPGKFQVLEYGGTEVNLVARCTGCRGEFEIRLSNLLRRGACPGCSPDRGEHRRPTAIADARKAGEAGGVTHLGISPSTWSDRRLQHHYFCHKHGKFSVGRPGPKVVCPRCRGYISPNDPDNLPAHLRSKPCDLYLIEVRDSVGVWTKIGISTNLPARKRNYARDGVAILRDTRVVRMTLYDALVIEREIKRWARAAIGRRKCPRKKWSGWSESFADTACALPAAFDREVARFRGGRRV